MPALIPPGPTHIINAFSLTFTDEKIAVLLAGAWQTVVCDFFVKMIGAEDIIGSVLRYLPVPENFQSEIIARSLRLYSLTESYSSVWADHWPLNHLDGWALEDEKLISSVELSWSELGDCWTYESPLRRDFSRRQAQVELDVLVALSMGLTIEQLIQIYTVQFPVMKGYEEVDEYDSRGRRLPNTGRKDAGGTEIRAARTSHDGTSPLTVSWEIDNGNQTVTRTFYPPFNRVDRIDDYRTAYRIFSERLGLVKKITEEIA